MNTVTDETVSKAEQAAGQRIAGVLAPVLTPFKRDLSPDAERWIRHCKWLLASNVGLAVFGTNSEANSMSADEKLELLERILAAGVDPRRMMPGTGCCALTETVRLTAYAVKRGCAGVLMLPPFYYKNVTDEGLYRSYSEIIERVGDERLRIYLYHIPPVSQTPISPALVERLLAKYPGIIAGMKDSSGDWNNTKTMLDNFAKDGFDVFAGAESFLLANMRSGGKGCISATANVNPAAIHKLYAEWRGADAERTQQNLNGVRSVFQKAPMIAAMKAAVAHFGNDPAWTTMRPPLVELDAAQTAAIVGELTAKGFLMPGLRN
jgi:4-hydroxy-tetrahydrodipicolinate synthase